MSAGYKQDIVSVGKLVISSHHSPVLVIIPMICWRLLRMPTIIHVCKNVWEMACVPFCWPDLVFGRIEGLGVGGSAQNLPKFQIPYLTPKSVRYVEFTHLMVILKFGWKKMTPSWPTGALSLYQWICNISSTRTTKHNLNFDTYHLRNNPDWHSAFQRYRGLGVADGVFLTK